MASEFWSLYQIEGRLRAALAAPLPGADAHLRVAPQPRPGWRPGHVPDGARMAASLVLLYPRGERASVLLTVRSGALLQHPGQVSFPGGSVEEAETIQEAALREAAEEVGVVPATVRVLGSLSRVYIPVSGYALYPIVGVTDRRPDLTPHAGEVGRILEVDLSGLIAAPGLRQGSSWRRDEHINVPFFELAGERVWGATAMILGELLMLLGGTLRPAPDGSDAVS